MGPQRSRSAERTAASVAIALFVWGAIASAAQGAAAPSSAPPVNLQSGLRTFLVEKPVEPTPRDLTRDPAQLPPKSPARHESLRMMFGLGYVEGADWGTELNLGGTFAGRQLQLDSLITKGSEGLLFEQGTLSLFDPASGWRLEAGDVFSHLRGAALGGRVSWNAIGNRRPAVAIYMPRRGMSERATIVSYRDQLQFGEQTLLDAEVATDRSYLLRSRLSISRLELEGFYRSNRPPFDSRDGSLSGGVSIWRGLALSGGLFQSVQGGDHSDWKTIAVRIPVSRFLDVTLERAFARSPGTYHATSAAMASLSAGDLRVFHRYQSGHYDAVRNGFAGSIERQQTQTMSSYSPGPRLNMTLQLATQQGDAGPAQHWEELQTTLKVTSTTTVRAVTGVPDIRNRERFQAYLRQELPHRLALQADYGRISAFQSIARELDRSRLKVMLFKTVDIATPARGAEISGRVVDDGGHGVAGARVRLGAYTADTAADGRYSFKHVPRGDYDLSLDAHNLPADFAWDGHRQRLSVTSTHAARIDLRVTPLNAIHGRIYVDRNDNELFDAGEAVEGAVVRVGERYTSTDHAGAYSFYNLWPDTYEITLHSVPPAFEPTGGPRTVTLGDGSPVTGADFHVVPKGKPVRWGNLSK